LVVDLDSFCDVGVCLEFAHGCLPFLIFNLRFGLGWDDHGAPFYVQVVDDLEQEVNQVGDVLVVRVHELAPKEQWQKRYEQITHFEKLLAEEGTTIIKFFLHISKEEQKERLQARLDDPDKRWKFAVGDLDERDMWDSYMAAFEEALSKTSTDSAPWYIVPANRKWFRDLVVSEVLVETLESLGLEYPEPTEDLDNVTIK